MSDSPKIVTLTLNPAVDRSCVTDTLQPNTKLSCRQVRYDPGGGGINVARAVHRLGGEALAVYACGGATGRHLTNLLEAEKVAQQPVEVERRTRQNMIVTEQSTEQQYRFGFAGAGLSENEQQKILDRLEQYEGMDYLVASGSLPPGVPADFYARLARLAGKKGVRLIVDTRGDAFREAVDAGLYLIKPNHRELSALADSALESEEDQESAAAELVEQGKCRVVVLSLGAAGVLVVGQGVKRRFRSPSVSIRSRVGAGDSTVAGLVLGLHRGMELLDAVRFGVAAGAAAVMTPGSELCRREDAESLYGQVE